MSEQRFIELETKISYQDHLLEDLHQVIYQQQLSIDLLEKNIQSLIKRFDESASIERNLANEKPPHY